MISFRRSVLTALAALAIVWAYPASAGAYTLNLLRVGWNKSTVTVLIKAATGVSPQAVSDVGVAIGDWNSALPGTAPNLVLLSSGSTADIVIHMKVGGGQILGQTSVKTVNPFSCVLQSVSIQLSGKAFGQTFSSTGTRNVARHELGHALGLGHTDKPGALMYPSLDASGVTGTTNVPIGSCELGGIDAIYPLPSNCSIQSSVPC